MEFLSGMAGAGLDFTKGVAGGNQRVFNRPKGNWDLSGQTREQQGAYGNFVNAAMYGAGPSAAQAQLMQGRDQAIKAAMMASASGRGTNAALANRQAIMQAGMTTQQAARDAAMLKAQEQQAAMQQYGNLLQAQRQADIEQARADLQASTAYEMKAADVGEGEATRRQKAYGGLITAVGSLAGSDIRMKENVQPVGYSQSDLALGAMARRPMADPQVLDQQMMQARGQQDWLKAYGYSPEQGAPAAGNSGGGGGLGGVLQGFGGGLSDERLKEENAALKAAIASYQQGGAQQGGSAAAQSVSPVVGAAAQIPTLAYDYKPEAVAKYPNLTSPKPQVGTSAQAMAENPVYSGSVEPGPDGYLAVSAPRATMNNIGVTSEIAREQMKQAQELEALKAAVLKSSPKANSPVGYQPTSLGSPTGLQPLRSGVPMSTPRDVATSRTMRDMAAPEYDAWEIPWDRVGQFESQPGREVQLPEGSVVEKREDKDEPSRYSYLVKVPRGAKPGQGPYGLQTSGFAPTTAEAERQFVQSGESTAGFDEERARVNPDDYYETPSAPGVAGGTTELANAGEEFNKAAANLNIVKSQKDRRAQIRQFANIVNRSRANTPSPQLIYDELDKRGAKVKKQEVVDALRQEYDL